MRALIDPRTRPVHGAAVRARPARAIVIPLSAQSPMSMRASFSRTTCRGAPASTRRGSRAASRAGRAHANRGGAIHCVSQKGDAPTHADRAGHRQRDAQTCWTRTRGRHARADGEASSTKVGPTRSESLLARGSEPDRGAARSLALPETLCSPDPIEEKADARKTPPTPRSQSSRPDVVCPCASRQAPVEKATRQAEIPVACAKPYFPQFLFSPVGVPRAR